MPLLRGKPAKGGEGIYKPDPLFESKSNMVFSYFCGFTGIYSTFCSMSQGGNEFDGDIEKFNSIFL